MTGKAADIHTAGDIASGKALIHRRGGVVAVVAPDMAGKTAHIGDAFDCAAGHTVADRSAVVLTHETAHIGKACHHNLCGASIDDPFVVEIDCSNVAAVDTDQAADAVAANRGNSADRMAVADFSGVLANQSAARRIGSDIAADSAIGDDALVAPSKDAGVNAAGDLSAAHRQVGNTRPSADHAEQAHIQRVRTFRGQVCDHMAVAVEAAGKRRFFGADGHPVLHFGEVNIRFQRVVAGEIVANLHDLLRRGDLAIHDRLELLDLSVRFHRRESNRLLRLVQIDVAVGVRASMCVAVKRKHVIPHDARILILERNNDRPHIVGTRGTLDFQGRCLGHFGGVERLTVVGVAPEEHIILAVQLLQLDTGAGDFRVAGNLGVFAVPTVCLEQGKLVAAVARMAHHQPPFTHLFIEDEGGVLLIANRTGIINLLHIDELEASGPWILRNQSRADLVIVDMAGGHHNPIATRLIVDDI